MEWLISLFIGTGIFGIGVTIVDMIGIFSHDDSGDGDSDGLIETDDGGDLDFDLELDNTDSGVDVDTDTDTDGDSGFEAEEASLIAHTHQNKGNVIITIITILRTLVYFCLGFGPIGLIATLGGNMFPFNLIWGVGAGIGSAIIAFSFKNLMRRELDSSIKEEDLIMEKGKVVVSILPGKQGKIRVKLGGAYTERYARAKDPEASIKTGSEVFVSDLEDDGVIVESVE